MPRRTLAVLGGTFDHFHRGHEALLATAFRVGDSVAIGVTTDRFLASQTKPVADRLEPYANRLRRLRRWLGRRYPGRRWRTVPLEDRFGGSILPGVGVLVVSADTRAGGRAVNRERRRRGLPAVPLVVVPLVLADDLVPISSRRIRAGEIDGAGRRTAPLPVGLAVEDPADRRDAERTVRSAFRTARITRVPFTSTGTLRSRARLAARAAAARRALGVAVAREGRSHRAFAVATGPIALGPTVAGAGWSRRLRDTLRPPSGRKGFGPPRP